MEPTTNTQPEQVPVAETSPATAVYAGFWLRFVAHIIDGIILAIFFAVLGGITHSNNFEYGMRMHRGFSDAGGVTWLALPVSWLYYSLMESSIWQATVGKRLMNIKVTDLDGLRISFGRATGRYFAKIISGIILLIGYIMAGFTAKKQALHDIIAKTLVIRNR